MPETKYTAVETPDGLRMLCGWFATCANPTDKATDHPALGPVPVCTRCAQRAGIPANQLMDATVTSA